MVGKASFCSGCCFKELSVNEIQCDIPYQHMQLYLPTYLPTFFSCPSPSWVHGILRLFSVFVPPPVDEHVGLCHILIIGNNANRHSYANISFVQQLLWNIVCWVYLVGLCYGVPLSIPCNRSLKKGVYWRKREEWGPEERVEADKWTYGQADRAEPWGQRRGLEKSRKRERLEHMEAERVGVVGQFFYMQPIPQPSGSCWWWWQEIMMMMMM